MDTKSRKTGLAGKLLVAAALVLLTLLEILLYPVYRSRVQSFGQPIYGTENFVYNVQRAAYALYWSHIQEALEIECLPSELYAPIDRLGTHEPALAEGVPDISNSEKQAYAYKSTNMDSDLSGWVNDQDYWIGDSAFQIIQNMPRQILSGEEKILEAGVLAQNEDIRALVSQGTPPQEYQYIVELTFNAQGVLSEAKTVYSIDEDTAAADALWQKVTQAGIENENVYQAPGDTTFYYALKRPELVGASNESYYAQFLRNENIRAMDFSGDILAYYAGLLAAAIMGFLLALKRPSRGFLHQLPFEAALPILCGCLLAVPLAHEMVTQTLFSGVENKLAEELHLQVFTTTALLWLFNAAMWLVLFSFTLWSVRALAQVFRAGIKNYLYCRCLGVRFCRWVWKIWMRLWNWMSAVDFSDKGKKKLLLLAGVNFLVTVFFCVICLPGLPGLLVYHCLILWLLLRQYRKYQKNYRTVLDFVEEMAKGNLSAEASGNAGPFEPLRKQLSTVRVGFQYAVEEEVKSQNMKTELISNVSHDLKTPLTAIITYVDLLKDESLTEEKRTEYIATLEKKSQRLKHLIEDLFEVSKAASGNVTMQMETVDLCALLKQIQYELSDQLEAGGIEYRWDIPDKRILLELDGQKTCRIFENLLLNISKYGMPGTRAYISARETDGWAQVIMKNISAAELDFDPSEITERFARGDKARHTEGSGLGLAIVRSFTELQNGQFTICIDGDLFKAEVRFPLGKLEASV